MSLLGNLFGKKPEAQPAAAAPTPAPEDLGKNPDYIKVFDNFGREVFFTKEQWRNDMLPGALKTNWNDPDKLYNVIVRALNDGFVSDILAAAEHLHAIDPMPSRGATIYAIALMKTDQLDAARALLETCIAQHGEEGILLTNLAKVFDAQGDKARAEQTLWHALELDPNGENGFNWYWSMQSERDDKEAGVKALDRIAVLPGSWRAQLWQARAALDRNQPDAAMLLYKTALHNAGTPAPTPLLMQMSGDLGNHALLTESLQLTEPAFDPRVHGLMVGNNLIKAHLETGGPDAAHRILEQLFSLQRPDWKPTLSYWDTEIAKARIGKEPAPPQTPLPMTMLTILGPVWLGPASPANALFPAVVEPAVAESSPLVCFLGCSASYVESPGVVVRQMADEPGRLSRALPLFFAEQVHFHTNASVQTLVPWVETEPGAFVLSGVQWSDADAANYARPVQPPCAFVVTSHISGVQGQPPHTWRIQLRLVRIGDAACLGELTADFNNSDPLANLETLTAQLISLLSQSATNLHKRVTPAYQLPDKLLGFYLLRLEQLLATRCSTLEGPHRGSLSGEREILDGTIHLALSAPTNLAVRLLLAQVLVAMRTSRPAIVAEFRARMDQLQRQAPLHDPADEVIAQLLDKAFAP